MRTRRHIDPTELESRGVQITATCDCGGWLKTSSNPPSAAAGIYRLWQTWHEGQGHTVTGPVDDTDAHYYGLAMAEHNNVYVDDHQYEPPGTPDRLTRIHNRHTGIRELTDAIIADIAYPRPEYDR